MPVADASALIRIRLFGALSVTIADQPETDQFPTQKIALALGYLALHQGEAQSREALGELLWPEVDPATQRVRLNTVVYNLRRILEPPPIVTGSVLLSGRHQITLSREGVHVDSQEFERLLTAAQHAHDSAGRAELMEQAVALYQGKLLPSFYEEEIVRSQERLELRCFHALLDLVSEWNATGLEAASKAIAAAQRAVALDPMSEAANLALIQSQANAGQPGAALQSYRRMEALLRQEMNTTPSSALRDLIETLRPVSAPAPEALIPNNLPAPLTSFIGREQESADVGRLLRETRLLTLSGTGGVGKTRLSLKVAATLVEQFPESYPDGIWVVELASLADPSLVGQAVASALRVREQPGQTIVATLREYLKDRRLLLVLDNCEHLVQSAAELVATLLRECSQITVLATSRERLGVGGETIYRVPSLSLPHPTHDYGAEALSQYESVRLFIARALSVKPGFRVSNRNAPALAQLCFRLDGIPLAIELAAARIRSLPVEQLNERVEHSFNLLTGGDRAALPRQQTLRALIDWSYALLDDAEKTLMARLSVFVGGWTLETAATVCGFSPVQSDNVLDLLTSLVDKSLILAESDQDAPLDPSVDPELMPAAARYRMLETIRQYATEKLDASGGTADVKEKFLGWAVDLAEAASTHLQGPEQVEWIRRLESEHDNLRAAPGFSETRNEDVSVDGLRLVAALGRFWYLRGYVTEGRESLERLIARLPKQARGSEPGSSESISQDGKLPAAKIYNVAGALAVAQGDYAVAQLHFEESLAVYREIGDNRGIASSLNNLGNLASDKADYFSARALFEESLAIRRAIGDRSGVANTLNSLGNLADSIRDYPAAKGYYEEALMYFREIGDIRRISNTLNNLGAAASNQGDIASAKRRFEECLPLCREIGDRVGIGSVMGNLGSLALTEADYAAARVNFRESVALFREIGDKRFVSTALRGYAAASQGEGQLRKAAVLSAAADALLLGIGVPIVENEQAGQAERLERLREALGEEEFMVAWGEGQALPWEQAVDLALDT